MEPRATLSFRRRTETVGRALAVLLASAMLLEAASAHADWWRPRGGSGSSSSSGSGSGTNSSGGRNSGSAGTPRPTTPPRGSYSPGSCSWVTISRQAQYVDPSGRTVYEITQKNSCTGEVRTLFGY